MYLAMERSKAEKPTSPIPGVRLRVLAPAQAACLLSPVLVKATGRGLEIKQTPEGLWELAAWVEESRFHPGMMGHLRHLCARLSPYLGQISLDCEPQERQRPPARGHKRFFAPFQVTPSLWVAPPGTGLELEQGQHLLELEIGKAGHCGLEPASRSALTLLEELLSRESVARALDARAGTGLFSMAAVRWGVQRVRALDQDPHSVAVARRNIRLNGLNRAVKAGCVPLERDGGLYDLVIAVETHRSLLRRARHLINRVARGGHLLLGGIGYGWTQRCVSRFCPPLSLIARHRELWWESLLLRRP